jgi:hypothetical protein
MPPGLGGLGGIGGGMLPGGPGMGGGMHVGPDHPFFADRYAQGHSHLGVVLRSLYARNARPMNCLVTV